MPLFLSWLQIVLCIHTCSQMCTIHTCSCAQSHIHTHNHQVLCSLAGANVGEMDDRIKNLQKVQFLIRNSSAQKGIQEHPEEVLAVQNPAAGKPQQGGTAGGYCSGRGLALRWGTTRGVVSSQLFPDLLSLFWIASRKQPRLTLTLGPRSF